jgi:PhnB protein
VNTPAVPNIAPWLAVRDAAQAVAYYTAAFGATEVYRLDGDGGRVEVAQLSIGGALFWVQNDPDASPDVCGAGPVRMILSVEDPDKFFAQSVSAGATAVAQVHEEHGWRTGRIIDPFGHDWELSKQLSP